MLGKVNDHMTKGELNYKKYSDLGRASYFIPFTLLVLVLLLVSIPQQNQ